MMVYTASYEAASKTPSTLVERFCARCGRALTDAASMEVGIGPICRGMDNHLLALQFNPDIEKARNLWHKNFAYEEGTGFHEQAWKTVVAVENELALASDGIQDLRKIVKQIEWILSYPTLPEIRERAYATVATLGYVALSNCWKGLSASGQAIVWVEEGRVFISAPRCKGGTAAMRSLPGRKGHTIPKTHPSAGGRAFAWSVPFSSFEAFKTAVLSYYPNNTGLVEAQDSIKALEYIGRAKEPSALSPKSAMLFVEKFRVRMKTPYNENFLNEFRASCPKSWRSWDPIAKEWSVNTPPSDYIEALKTLISKYYSLVVEVLT